MYELRSMCGKVSEEDYSVRRNPMKRILELFWKDIKDARWAIICLIAYFVLASKFLYSTCPVVMITGFPCPACGLTRAAFLLIHLDFPGAFHMHPFIYVIVLFAVAFVWRRYVCAIRQDKLLKWTAVVIIVFMTLFYVGRMAMQFPGASPMQYYDESILGRFLNAV